MNVEENVTIANLAPPLNMTVPRKVKQNNRNNLRAKENMLKNINTGSEMTVEIFCRTVLLQFFGVHPPKITIRKSCTYYIFILARAGIEMNPISTSPGVASSSRYLQYDQVGSILGGTPFHETKLGGRLHLVNFHDRHRQWERYHNKAHTSWLIGNLPPRCRLWFPPKQARGGVDRYQSNRRGAMSEIWFFSPPLRKTQEQIATSKLPKIMNVCGLFDLPNVEGCGK